MKRVEKHSNSLTELPIAESCQGRRNVFLRGSLEIAFSSYSEVLSIGRADENWWWRLLLLLLRHLCMYWRRHGTAILGQSSALNPSM